MAEVKDDEYEADEESDESEYESSEEASDADHKSDSCTQAEMGISASRRAKRKGVAQHDNSIPFKKMKKNRNFLPYEEAKKVVNALGLKNQDDWKRWSCTERPPDIPGNPWISYKNAGWNGFADWLGQPNEQIYTYVIEGIIIDEIVKLGY